MTKRIFFTLLLCGASFTALADAVAAVQQFHQALAAGERDNALNYLDDSVMIYESGHKEKSKAEYAAHHLDSDIAFSREVARKVTATSRITHGDYETVLQETESSGSYKGKAVHLVGLETMLLKKTDQGWKIQHIHWSSRKAH